MYDNLLEKLKNFAVRVDENRTIFGSSYCLEDSNLKDNFLHKDINVLLSYLFRSDFFNSPQIVDKLNSFINKSIKNKKSIVTNVVGLNHNKDKMNFCDFMFGIDVFLEPHLTFTIKFLDYKLIDKEYGNYDEIFHDFSDKFDVIKNKETIGKFVVDFKKNPNIIIGNDVLPSLLSIPKEPTNEYYISRHNKTEQHNNILRNKNFFIKTDLLIKNEISSLEDVWENNGKWLKVEAKILKRDYDGTPMLLGGVLYDISSFVKYKHFEDLQSIYEFAITSGSIGIFYYNYELHPDRYFDANKIYAKMLGLKPNSDNLYHLDDFESILQPLEDDISTNKDIRSSLNDLLNGDIDGTTDDILKIKNKETNEIKYLLSSSRVEARYKNGKPKYFGGIVIDITERINVQKNQIEFAYVDELTKLPNNRKLLKDMNKKDEGIGLFYDLDHFKLINDKYGHITGNKILKIFADTLCQLKIDYPNTFPYRLYGDEFFVYCDTNDESFGEIYNEMLKTLLPKNVKIQFPDIKVEASVGIALYNKSNSVDEFIKLADYAMYKEKILKNELKTKKQ